MFKFKIARRLKNIRKKLEDINANKSTFELTPNAVSEDATGIGGTIPNRETGSLVNLSKIYTRDKEKIMLIDKICNQDTRHDDDDVRVYATWGMGGIGNTLAHYVYNHEMHNVGVLSEEESWSLFKMLAFPGGGKRSNVRELQLVGREIVDKCKGLPLAVKSLCNLISTRKKVNEWQLVNDKFMLEMQDNGILPALRLNYDNLLPHLKRFSFIVVYFQKAID
ncbi:disease resistance protein [Tanacetum coccineum]